MKHKSTSKFGRINRLALRPNRLYPLIMKENILNIDMNVNWNRYTHASPPPKHERVLISDGETITIARQMPDNSDSNVFYWIFDNQNAADIQVKWWTTLPELPPVINTVEAI